MHIIRSETPRDFDAVYSLVQEAFASVSNADGDEQDFVSEMRFHAGYMRDLALVAEKDGELAGYALLTETHITGSGADFPVLLLAPLCVREESRGKGLAGKLLREGFKRALARGYEAVFLAGNPEYYAKFGFRAAGDFGISHELPVDDKYILALELVPSALEGKTGTVFLTGHTTCAAATDQATDRTTDRVGEASGAPCLC